MTTPRPDDYIIIATLRDLPSLQLVERVLDSQRLVLELQLGQIGKLQEASEGTHEGNQRLSGRTAFGSGMRSRRMRGRWYVGLAATIHDPAIAIIDPGGCVVFAEATERRLQDKRAYNSPPDGMVDVGSPR